MHIQKIRRVVANQALQELVGNLDIQHLGRTRSDHAPLLLTCSEANHNFSKPFRFLKFLSSREDFKDVVKENWTVYYPCDIMIQWKLRQNKTKLVLAKWSRDVFGDIFKQLLIRE